MKKIMLVVAVVFYLFLTAGAQSSNFYQLQVPGASGVPVPMTVFTGKKVLVAVCSAASPDTKWVLSLDSLQKKNMGVLAVMIIPVQDFDPSKPVVNIQNMLVDGLNLTSTMCQTGLGKKSAGPSQQNLLQWLTNSSANRHFDYDLTSLRQIFVVSEKGRLFAVTQGANDLYSYIGSILSAQVPDN